jgi:hypothetical protein
MNHLQGPDGDASDVLMILVVTIGVFKVELCVSFVQQFCFLGIKCTPIKSMYYSVDRAKLALVILTYTGSITENSQ